MAKLNAIMANTGVIKDWLKGAVVPKNKSYVLGGRGRGGMAASLTQRVLAGGLSKEKAASIAGRYNRRYGNASVPGKLMAAAQTPYRYVNDAVRTGNYGQAALRAGIVGAGYIGAAGTIKSVIGAGGMWKDSNGNRDIAGIPFI